MKLEWRKYVTINIFLGISRYNIWVWCIEIYHFFSNFIFIHTDKRKMRLFLRTTVCLWWLCLGDFCISISLLILVPEFAILLYIRVISCYLTRKKRMYCFTISTFGISRSYEFEYIFFKNTKTCWVPNFVIYSI